MDKLSRSGIFAFGLALLLYCVPASAQDRIFNYTYQSLVLAKGQQELEIWNTVRWGRADYFRALDHRIEFEVGLGGKLQTSFYLNARAISFKAASVEFVPTTSGQFAPATFPSLQTETSMSFSNEWKYKLSDPLADEFGAALYAEYTIGTSKAELESKVILDKNFEDFVTAFNVVGALEFEKEIEGNGEEKTGKEKELEFDFGIAYQIADGMHLGIEAVNRNKISEEGWEYSALFIGPTFAYATERFWANVTILPQLTALKGATRNGLVLDDLERVEIRLLFSYAF